MTKEPRSRIVRWRLILTTPNVVSFTSVARVLEASGSPQIYSLYPAARAKRPHVHENTPYELEKLLLAAGSR